MKISHRLVYLFVVLALLVGLVPAAVFAYSPRDLNGPGPIVDWNVLGAEQTWTIPSDADATGWHFTPKDGLTGYSLLSGGGPDDTSATVKASSVGALEVDVTDIRDIAYHGEKKWGEIWRTEISGPGETQMWWNEYEKDWSGFGWVSDTVYGAFMFDWASPDQHLEEHLADGAIVWWYLFDASLDITSLNRLDNGAVLKDELDALLATHGARWVWFESGNTGAAPNGDLPADGSGGGDQSVWTLSGEWGTPGYTGVEFEADAEEPVRIVALVDYPSPQGTQHLVRPEFTSWNFWTQEMEKVPQVRWAGEKIVLEKYWGMEFANGPFLVHYAIEGGSPGTLETVTPVLLNLDNTSDSVWTWIQGDGTSQVILTSEKPGEVDVTCSLYWYPWLDNYADGPYEGDSMLINQHGFVVFFLKLESIELTKVVGEREGHNDGLWLPENPWDATLDLTSIEANVSADDLLRVRVKGWFMGDDLSMRDKLPLDTDRDGTPDMMLPEGRWVLPDDWAILAGPMWNEFRPHWDIMDQPNDDIVTVNDWWYYYGPYPGVNDTDPLGPYGYIDTWDSWGWPEPTLVAGYVDWYTYEWWPVIGPYSSLDDGQPDGLYLPYTSEPGAVARDTIVPNGALNEWDCPMPPAKITFEIMSGPGYFKPADKADIYYQLVDASTIWTWLAPGYAYVIQYTNPFYSIEVPANEEIPPYLNNGGYDWDSWDWTTRGDGMGPYDLWVGDQEQPRFLNQLPNQYAPSDATHPTKVQVYSDNHGEAMVWLNGDWNLDLSPWESGKGYYDIPYMEEVGETTVVAIADYPYLRKHTPILSDEVTNTWTWGKEIIILVEQLKDSNQDPDPTNKRIWALVSDRDRFAAIQEAVQWHAEPIAMIEAWLNGDMTMTQVADWTTTDGDPKEGRYGWFTGLTGWMDVNSNHATTWTRDATADEQEYLGNLFGIPYDPLHPELYAYGITAITLHCSEATGVDLKVELDQRVRPDGSEGEGLIVRHAMSAGTMFPYELDYTQYILNPGLDPTDPVEELAAGWNLVVFKAGNQSVAQAISSISGNVVSVWSFDNQTKLWDAFSPTAPAWANDLTMMNSATAYWIEVSASITWYYS